MKSNAPSLVARTAVSMLPWPEMTITGVSGSESRMRRERARCRPSRASRCRGSRGAGRSLASSSSARARPPPRARDSPRRPARRAALSRMSASSSTTRMVSSAVPCSLTPSPRRFAQDDLLGLPSHRELDDETAAARLVVLHADEALMVGDDRRHDRRARGRSRLAWSRSTARRAGARTSASCRRRCRRPRARRCRARDRSACGPRCAARRRSARVQRGDRVVEHVDERALDALAIERQQRQRRVGDRTLKPIWRWPSRKSTSASSTSAFRSSGRVLARRAGARTSRTRSRASSARRPAG